MEKIKTFDKYFWIGLLSFIVFVAAICFLPLVLTISPGIKDFTNTGQIGDTIGGIMGPFIAIGVGALTFLAFWVQFKANEQQKIALKKQDDEHVIERFEAKLFEMFKIHRENVSELVVEYRDFIFKRDHHIPQRAEVAESRKAFRVVYSDLESLNDELIMFFNISKEDIYLEEYLKMLLENPEISSRNIDLVCYAKSDILFCILYFGLSEEGKASLIKVFEKRYKNDFVDKILNFVALKPEATSRWWSDWSRFNNKPLTDKLLVIKEWNLWRKTSIRYTKFFETNPLMISYNDLFTEAHTKYYGGHQFRLGHYFRHFYNILTFVNNNKNSSFTEKYEIFKILRGQLSAYELLIIFIHSISILGRRAELEKLEQPNVANDLNFQLVTKFNLFKNILDEKLLDNIYVASFYPDILYDTKVNPDSLAKRASLVLNYK